MRGPVAVSILLSLLIRGSAAGQAVPGPVFVPRMDKSEFTQPDDIPRPPAPEVKTPCQDKEGAAFADCVEQLPSPSGPPPFSIVTTAAQRRRGQRQFLAGSVLVPVGLATAIASAIPLIRGQGLHGQYDTPLLATGATMACLGVGLVAAGAAVLTIGNRNRTRPPTVASRRRRFDA